MYGSPVSKDLNLPAQPPPMASSGLLRYRSAPSAVLGGLCEDQLQLPAAAPSAADNVFSRFLPDHHIRDDKPSPAHFPSAADMASHHQQEQMMFHSQSQSQHQQETGRSGGGLYRTVSSGMEAGGTGVGAASSLIRQSSSPAGFLDHFGMDNGWLLVTRSRSLSLLKSGLHLVLPRLPFPACFHSLPVQLLGRGSRHGWQQQLLQFLPGEGVSPPPKHFYFRN
jgi:hypothetical protein